MKYTIRALLAFFVIGSIVSCHSQKMTRDVPVLSPKESIKAMQVEKGFKVKIVASEPLISSPVAMAFDDSLNLWVAEMNNGFSPMDSSKQAPNGKVVILKDTNSDGRMDISKTFMDSLYAPRAICIVDGGILLATPPNLWYIKDNHGQAGKKILVDSAYTVSKNKEGQTNGLIRSLNNWIYSAGFGSDKRYRRINGKWVIRHTFFRGQFGITQDNYGRLFYNNNSTNLLGDYFIPGFGAGNPGQKHVSGYNENIVPDNRVYPIHPTPGVNRGYRKGVLDNNLRLTHFTAACGPVIYRGGTFGKAYEGNAFVAEPAGNLIKRDILTDDGFKVSGKQAYQGKEFLASTDVRFRPVNLYNGPDGALYVVDFYRGMIEGQNTTNYLKEYILKHDLVSPTDLGRIYKIVPKGKKDKMVNIPSNPKKLVQLLKSPNGWVRDHAQQELVEQRYTKAIPSLRKLLLQKSDYPLAAIHALWTLEGLNAVQPGDIKAMLKGANKHLQMEAVAVLAAIIDQNNYKKYVPVVKQLISDNDSVAAPYVAYAINSLHDYAPKVAGHLLDTLIPLYVNNRYVMDAVISGLQGQEKEYINKFTDSTTYFHQHLATILGNKAKNNKKREKKLLAKLRKKYPEGYITYHAICQTCHDTDGNGIKFTAPPLNGSEWVTGNKNRTIAIVLHGLTGPIKVKGKIYKKPEITGNMPAFGNNFSDQKVAEIVSFIRKNWGNRASEVTVNDVKKVRHRFNDREKAFTPSDLNHIFGK